MGDDYKDYTITIGSADESVSTYKWGSLDPTYTVCTSDLSDTITLDNLTTEDYITKNFLDQTEIEDMCVEYPTLRIAYEKFKHIYDLVYQDWKGKQEA
tara:strand:+ start:1322 stop:1615 length:294 start_codon:yes stop_codon:yes gene_type:complete